MKGIVADLTSVIQEAGETIRSKDLESRCETIECDFFKNNLYHICTSFKKNMTTISKGKKDMEIQTTIKNFPQKVKSLNIPPETPIRVIIKKIKGIEKMAYQKPYLPFLDDNDFWDSEATPKDLSVNVDKYLYDE